MKRLVEWNSEGDEGEEEEASVDSPSVLSTDEESERFVLQDDRTLLPEDGVMSDILWRVWNATGEESPPPFIGELPPGWKDRDTLTNADAGAGTPTTPVSDTLDIGEGEVSVLGDHDIAAVGECS